MSIPKLSEPFSHLTKKINEEKEKRYLYYEVLCSFFRHFIVHTNISNYSLVQQKSDYVLEFARKHDFIVIESCTSENYITLKLPFLDSEGNFNEANRYKIDQLIHNPRGDLAKKLNSKLAWNLFLIYNFIKEQSVKYFIEETISYSEEKLLEKINNLINDSSSDLSKPIEIDWLVKINNRGNLELYSTECKQETRPLVPLRINESDVIVDGYLPCNKTANIFDRCRSFEIMIDGTSILSDSIKLKSIVADIERDSNVVAQVEIPIPEDQQRLTISEHTDMERMRSTRLDYRDTVWVNGVQEQLVINASISCDRITSDVNMSCNIKKVFPEQTINVIPICYKLDVKELTENIYLDKIPHAENLIMTTEITDGRVIDFKGSAQTLAYVFDVHRNIDAKYLEKEDLIHLSVGVSGNRFPLQPLAPVKH